MSPFTPENNRALDLISLIGIGMSIGSLIISIIIEAITWKYLTKNKTSYIRNVVILNIIVSLLMANGLTAVPLFVHPTQLYCTILTFLKHFFFLALFFWKLSLGLLLLYHLIFVFHDFSISVITTMCFIVGYLCPIIIASITIALTYPKNQYNLQKECWLEWKNRKVLLAFVGPMSAIIAINICIVLVAICKLLRPTIGEHSKYHSKGSFKQILRSVVILTPVLGLTWIIGFPNLSKDSALYQMQGLLLLYYYCCCTNARRWSLHKCKIPKFGFIYLADTSWRSCSNLFARSVGCKQLFNLIYMHRTRWQQ
uniref:G-protein coupled receptors family 2 profile 2 domain-containing protein n=1 Tax=Callorhinchus milii TaxID=7868 RepID=A0A4W3HTF8_CALMI